MADRSRYAVLVRNKPFRPTQPPVLSEMRIEYRPEAVAGKEGLASRRITDCVVIYQQAS